jgi:hypothetical protein
MNRRSLLVYFVLGLVLVALLLGLVLFLSPTLRYRLLARVDLTGTAAQRFDNATLVVIPVQIDPAVADGMSSTTDQAIGVVIGSDPPFKGVSLVTGSSLQLDQAGPINVSADSKYIQIGHQQIRLVDWTIVAPAERGWMPLRDDVQTALDGVRSSDNQFSFSIKSNRAGFPLWRGDWVISVITHQNKVKTLYYGLGKVQQAGWATDQQSIFVGNDGRILQIPL